MKIDLNDKMVQAQIMRVIEAVINEKGVYYVSYPEFSILNNDAMKVFHMKHDGELDPEYVENLKNRVYHALKRLKVIEEELKEIIEIFKYM